MNLSISVRKRYGSFDMSADVTLSGDRIGVFGASGSGKSTLVGMLAGLVKPDSGEIILDGDCLFSSARGIDVPPAARRIGMVFQQHELFPHLSVSGNLDYGHRRCPPQLRRIDFDRLVEVLQIGSLLRRSIANLSGGERQRVAIGRAVLSNPRLLLMDEPLSALDDDLRFQIIPYLKSVSEEFGIPYIFISHSLVEMRMMADEVVAMAAGAVVAQTSAEELARVRMGHSPVGYINLLSLSNPRRMNGLYRYQWGEAELLTTAGCAKEESLFELSSKDIILFKKHPDAISSRNLLRCCVVDTFTSGAKVGVELESGGGRLMAEVVSDAADELGIRAGSVVYAAIKASAFRHTA